MRDLTKLPDDLPIPTDDGAAAHLTGHTAPPISLPSIAGRNVNLADLARNRAVLFFYPRTGRPDEPAPIDWDRVPGARGCTPQSCGFRDQYADFTTLGVQVFGVSTQATDYQREFATRMHIPFELLSDNDLKLTTALQLPTMHWQAPSGGPPTLIKRMSWYLANGKIEKVWYPVFPPNENAAQVLTWLRTIPNG